MSTFCLRSAQIVLVAVVCFFYWLKNSQPSYEMLVFVDIDVWLLSSQVTLIYLFLIFVNVF